MMPTYFPRRTPIAIALLLASVILYLPPAMASDFSKVAVPGMNTQVAPGDDFSRFVNGGWEAATEIPADHVSWSTFTQMSEDNLKKMAMLYEDASKGAAGTSAAAKRVGDYYAAQVNEAGIEARGLTSIKPTLDQIAALDSKTALAKYLGAHLRADVDPLNLGSIDSENLFGLWVAPGLHDTEHYMPYLLQGGLGLPDPSFYVADNPEQKAVRDEYRNYMIVLLEQAGIADATGKADSILDLETRIAKTHANRPDSSDLVKVDQVWRRADFASKAKGLDWEAYFAAAGLSMQASFGAWQPDAIKGIAALVEATPLDVWQDYLRFHAINASARFLPKAIADRYFAFNDPLALGPSQHFPRWVHAVFQTNTFMPGAGRLFVGRYFSPQAKAKAQEIVNNMVAAFDRHIDQAAWMTPATRMEAKAKLKAMHIGVGYTDQWRDSTGLEIKADDASGNALRVAAFNYKYELSKLGKKVDRSEWILGGELFGVNRMPLQNAMTIPAFELQSPEFDPNGSDAANYAAIGAKIGHFLALGFGERGSKFDAQGRVRNWWTAADLAGFRNSTAPLVAQYSRYKPFPDMAVNGQQTLNQNIADLAGVLTSYDAYRKQRAAAHDMEDAKTADQRFFIAYALSFRNKDSEQALRGQTAGSPVAPETYRAATVRNLDGWYSSFDVLPGQALYLAPDERVKIW